MLLLSLASLAWVAAAAKHRAPQGLPLQGEDAPLPPSLLLLSLHGVKAEAAKKSNQLRRFTVSGARSTSGTSKLMLAPLPSLELIGEDGGSTLRYPRSLAARGDTLFVASAGGGLAGSAVLSTLLPTSCAQTAPLHAQPACPGSVLDHPYGVAISGSDIIVTNQGSGDVTRCAGDGTSRVIARHPTALTSAGVSNASLPRSGEAGSPVRGIAVDPATGSFYVAAKDDNTVFVYSADGRPQATIKCKAPIVLLWDVARGGLFIGSASKKAVMVAFWNAKLSAITVTFTHDDGAGHAAGMAIVGGALLVLGQAAGSLYQFDLATGRMVATLAEGLNRPEGLLSVPCSQ